MILKADPKKAAVLMVHVWEEVGVGRGIVGEGGWRKGGLFSSFVSYQAELPLHFSLYNFPPSTEKTLMHFFSLCLCL